MRRVALAGILGLLISLGLAGGSAAQRHVVTDDSPLPFERTENVPGPSLEDEFGDGNESSRTVELLFGVAGIVVILAYALFRYQARAIRR